MENTNFQKTISNEVDSPWTIVNGKYQFPKKAIVNGPQTTVRRGLALLAQLLRIQKTNNKQQFPQEVHRP
jgi:hypothetical protein